MVMVTLAALTKVANNEVQTETRDSRLSQEQKWQNGEPSSWTENLSQTTTTTTCWTEWETLTLLQWRVEQPTMYVYVCVCVRVCVHKLFSIFERRVLLCTFPLTIIAGLYQSYTFSFVVVLAIRYGKTQNINNKSVFLYTFAVLGWVRRKHQWKGQKRG